MNVIPDWSGKCIMCGCTDLMKTKLILREVEYEAAICTECYAVFVCREESINFMGFLPEEIYKGILALDNPVIKAEAAPVQEDYELN